jgi:creatinine amidohydrolase
VGDLDDAAARASFGGGFQRRGFGEPFTPAARGWIMKDRSVPGHIGQPHLASAEKGETLFRLFSDDLIAFLERVIRWDGKSWDG